MGTMASQITSLTIVYSTVYSGADQRKHQSSASLAFVRGIHRGPVNSPHKWPVTRKIVPFDDVIMDFCTSYFSVLVEVMSVIFALVGSTSVTNFSLRIAYLWPCCPPRKNICDFFVLAENMSRIALSLHHACIWLLCLYGKRIFLSLREAYLGLLCPCGSNIFDFYVLAECISMTAFSLR